MPRRPSIARQLENVHLNPGEVFVSAQPLVVSTLLGSCVAVTIHSPSGGFGAICHSMLPENCRRDNDLRYVDTALNHIIDRLKTFGEQSDLEVKLFGGGKVLDTGAVDQSRSSIGEQNIARAEEVISALGLKIVARDTGGVVGRKLFFSPQTGEVYLRKMRNRKGELS